MKKELQLVRGAVATKDLIPVLTHFHFYDGRVQGGNGALCIDTALECSHKEPFTVPAKPFLAAVDACGGTPNLSVSAAGRLTVSKGRFRAVLPLMPSDAYPRVISAPARPPVDPDFAAPLRALEPFIGSDASRPWACGVLLKDGFAYATNNVVLARVAVPWDMPPANLPGDALRELLRIAKPITYVAHGPGGIEFGFEDAWLSARLLDLAWPDVEKMLPGLSEPERVPEGIVEAVETVIKFAPDGSFPVVTLGPQGAASGDAAYDIELPGLGQPMAFAAEPLLEVLRAAVDIDYSLSPVAWAGDNIHGIIVHRRS